MPVFKLVVALLLVGAVLAALARRVSAPYPALLALAGAGLALLPNLPEVTLDPELALTLLVAPVLLDAAFDSSPRDLRHSWRAVTGLALVAVGLTVAAVAVVARWLVPGIPWPAALALGAVVAPPDAAAATTVLAQLRPPHRILVILQGESLFNDASALLIYRLAVAAAVTGSFGGWGAVPTLALVAAGSVALGAAARAALAAVAGATQGAAAGDGEMVGFLRRKYQARLLRAEQGEQALDPAEADGWRDFGSVQRRAQAEERRRLSDLRARGVIGDDAFHRVEEELDWAEVHAETRRQ